MTIPSTVRKAGPLLGTGAQTAWPFTFKVFAAADISVTIANSTGVETALVLDTDYSVTLNPNQDTSPGGTVTYPISGAGLPVGSVLSIVGDLEYDQPLDLPSGGNFSPVALENELDRLTMQIQQLRETISRSLLVPVTSDAAPSLPTPEANQLIGWDVSGQNLQNVPVSSLATAVGYGTFRFDTFTGNGVTTEYALTSDPAAIGNLDVAIDGLTVYPSADYTLVSGTVVFTVAPSNGAEILVRYGQALPITGAVDASAVTYQPAGVGSQLTDVQEKLRSTVSILDFGPKGNGTTDDDAPLFNLAIASGAKHIIVPHHATRYLLLSPINMTTNTGLTVPPARACGITLEFQTSLDINSTPNGTQPILAKHTGHVLDMSGSRDCTIIGMNVEGDATVTPSTMIFMARNSVGSDCGRHRFHNIRSAGSFTAAPLYNYGGEELYFFAPLLTNARAGKGAVYLTGSNAASLTSSFITIITGGQSTSVLRFIGGQYHASGNSGSTNEVVFYMDGVEDVSITDSFFYCPYGLAHIAIQTLNQPTNLVRIDACRGEIGADLPTYGVYFNNAAPQTHVNWSITNSRLACDSFATYLEDNQTVNNLDFQDNVMQAGFAVGFRNLNDSIVKHNSYYVTGRAGGTCARNVFIGYGSSRSLSGTNITNTLIDTLGGVLEVGSGYKFPATQVASANANTLDDYEEGTWTPALTCATPGNLSTTFDVAGRYTKIGNLVTVIGSMAATAPITHTTASGQVRITGLPFVADSTSFTPIAAFAGFTSAGYTAIGGQLVATLGNVYLNKSGSGVANAAVNITDIPSGGLPVFHFTISYFTA